MMRRSDRAAWGLAPNGRALAAVLAAIIVVTLTVLLLPPPALAAGFDFHTADFTILSAASAQPIGHVHYDVSDLGAGAEIVTSDARYDNGDYDIERDEFDTRQHSIPVMANYEHHFFHAGGRPLMTSKADFTTGRAWCTRYVEGQPVVASETIAFPPDAYAGAAIILPLQASLRAGNRGPIVVHDFVCMPGPKLVKVRAYARVPEPWNHYSGDVVRTDIKPDFGWLDYLIAPFLPEMHAWFSPADGFAFVGGQFSRYYKGQEIIIARQPAAPADGLAAGRNAPPASAH